MTIYSPGKVDHFGVQNRRFGQQWPRPVTLLNINNLGFTLTISLVAPLHAALDGAARRP
jgi:hypothetical protein